MPRFFNTAGPCDPAKHLMLPLERRVRMIEPSSACELLPEAEQAGKSITVLRL